VDAVRCEDFPGETREWEVFLIGKTMTTQRGGRGKKKAKLKENYVEESEKGGKRGGLKPYYETLLKKKI